MLRNNSNLGSIVTKIEKSNINGGRTGGDDSSEVDDCRNDHKNQCRCGAPAGEETCH